MANLFECRTARERTIYLLETYLDVIKQGRGEVAEEPKHGSAIDVGYSRDPTAQYMTIVVKPVARKQTEVPVVPGPVIRPRCPICNESCASERGLKSHMSRSHRGEKALERRAAQ